MDEKKRAGDEYRALRLKTPSRMDFADDTPQQASHRRSYMSQTEWGLALGVAQYTVSHWERGTWRPSEERVEKMKELAGG